jgi:inner membrane transporter RhtA
LKTNLHRRRAHTGLVDAPNRSAALVWRVPPHALFVAGALTQYLGAALAVLLFERVEVVGVAWLRVAAAAIVLAAWARPLCSAVSWTRARIGLVAAFGLALAGMNTAFYLAIDHLPLGTAVALEFAGPIAVTALGSRTRRDLVAVLVAAAGVVLLSDVHVSGSPLEVAMALLPRARFALLLALLPATATLAGLVVLGQVPSPPEAVGIALVVLATALGSHGSER